MLQLDRRFAIKSLGAAIAYQSLERFSQGATTQSRQRIKIGQIGVTHGHATKLSVYRNSPDYEVVGIVEPNESNRRQMKDHPAFRDLPWLTRDELLATPGLQAVLVETEIRELLDNAERCVDAGLHVHIDKPAGEDLDHLRRILNKASSKKLMIQMGYMYRYNPGVTRLHELLKRGMLGDVFEVHAVMSKVLSPAERKAPAQYPGGMMFELGCHLIDLVVGILGKPVRVHSYARHSSVIEDALLDNMLAVLEYPKSTATVRTSCLEIEGNQRRHLVVCGTKGTCQIQPLDSPKMQLALDESQGTYKKGYQEIALPKYTRYVDDAADMARVIRGEKGSDFTIEHDMAVQATVFEACGLFRPANP